MRSAFAIRLQIETALAHRIPSALTPAQKIIRPVVATGVAAVDELLDGGLPIGAITEMTGPESSGRTSLALSFAARVTQEGGVCAWIDACDALQVESAGAAGIDLSRLRGSGPHGRIVARDVQTAPRLAAAPGLAVLAESLTADQVKALFDPSSYEEVPLDAMRRTIAARLAQAKQTIPHFYLTADITIDRLIALREEVNAAAPKDRDGKPLFKLSVNDFIIRALALALQRVPAANAVWAADRILRFERSDIGVAVAIEGGLIAPIIRSADAKSLSKISAEMKELAARARDKKLKPADYQGGSSAISNLGRYGVREFSAIINPPQATILAVGAARRQAVETTEGGVAFASVLTTTLSCDHRVVDGALGAELLAAIKTLIETPVMMLV